LTIGEVCLNGGVWMPASEGSSTLSMAWCRAAITPTWSRTHSHVWLCGGGSSFPTTTPPQPPGGKHVVILFRHSPPRPYHHLRIPKISPVISNMQKQLRKQTPTSKRNKHQEKNEKPQRNEETNVNLTQKPKLSNLPPKAPTLIFHPICSEGWLSGLPSVRILPSRVLRAHTFVVVSRDGAHNPGLRHPPCILHSSYLVPLQRDGAHDPMLSAPIPSSRFNQTVLTPAVSSVPVEPSWHLYPPGALLAVVSSISTSCTLQMHPCEVRIAPMSTKCASLFLVHFSPPSPLLSSCGEKKRNLPYLALWVKHTLHSHHRSPSASLCSIE